MLLHSGSSRGSAKGSSPSTDLECEGSPGGVRAGPHDVVYDSDGSKMTVVQVQEAEAKARRDTLRKQKLALEKLARYVDSEHRSERAVQEAEAKAKRNAQWQENFFRWYHLLESTGLRWRYREQRLQCRIARWRAQVNVAAAASRLHACLIHRQRRLRARIALWRTQCRQQLWFLFAGEPGKKAIDRYGKQVGYRHDGVYIEDLDALVKYRQGRQGGSLVITDSSQTNWFKQFTSHEAFEAYKKICLWDRPEVTCDDWDHLCSLYDENSML